MVDRDRPDSHLTRRAFVELLGKGAIVVVLGEILRLWEGGEYIPRPPGARPEDEFLSLCLRCDLCREACPWDIIVPIPIAESLINAGTPVLRGSCRYCDLCIEACPTGALL
jgi:ferredoxin-type protein NapG